MEELRETQTPFFSSVFDIYVARDGTIHSLRTINNIGNDGRRHDPGHFDARGPMKVGGKAVLSPGRRSSEATQMVSSGAQAGQELAEVEVTSEADGPTF